MSRRLSLSRWTYTMAALAAAIVAAPLTPSADAAVARAGCDPTRPAVAYHVGAGVITPDAAGTPIPCLEFVSGRAGESANVGVLPSGRVLYAPLVANTYPAPLDLLGPALVGASDDGGSSWQRLAPAGTSHLLFVPPWMNVDPVTHRIWFASALWDLCGGDLSWSDDGGTTWRTNSEVGCPAMGSERVLEGPAPIGGAQPAGYPHVVYYCGNLTDFSLSNLWCYRSLDGGSSFSFVGGFPDPWPESGCATEHAARPGVVGTDGDLYFPVYQCGEVSVAISGDEGASWHLVPVATSNVQDLYTTSVAVDAAGNVYVAWIAGSGNASADGILGSGEPMLSISRDRGASWSAPVAVGPPGLQDAQTISISASGVGRIAISYLANTDGSSLLDGWLSETDQALAPSPLWWAASLNDPSAPLINSANSTTFGNRLFFATDTFAPDGDPWAAFQCADTVACPGARVGVVGYLSP